MWSPHFVPRPKDWPEHVDIVGSIFSDANHSLPSFPTSISTSASVSISTPTPCTPSISTSPGSSNHPLSNSNNIFHNNNSCFGPQFSQFFGSNSCYNSRSGSRSLFISHSNNHNSKLDPSSSQSNCNKSPHTGIRQEKSLDIEYSPPLELLAFFTYRPQSGQCSDLNSNRNSNSNININMNVNNQNNVNNENNQIKSKQAVNVHKDCNFKNNENARCRTGNIETDVHSKTPIFIGFGSMVIENPKSLLQVLLQGKRNTFFVHF